MSLRSVLGWGLGVATTVGVFLIQHKVSTRARGGRQDPLPYKGEHPSEGRMVYPDQEAADPDEVAALLREATGMSDEQILPLMGHFMLVTHEGGHVIGRNPAVLAADADWPGLWTTARDATLSGGKPRHQWTPIRAYPSLRLGVQDWVKNLSPGVLAALQAGDGDTAARLMAAHQVVDPERYVTHLADAGARWWSQRGTGAGAPMEPPGFPESIA